MLKTAETFIINIIELGVKLQMPKVNNPMRKFINHLEFERVKSDVKEAVLITIESIATKI